ncbi:MAG: Response regulator protein VraR [Acidimicrobiales bacterium]|nr:Response regulator protein VraR [Acidimicrobiales bacterium]
MGGEIADAPVTVLVVDARTETLRRWADAIDADPQMEVITTAATPQEAMERTLELVPDAVVLGLGAPGDDSTELCRQIRRMAPAISIVVAAPADRDEDAYECLLSGASSVISADSSEASIATAVRGATQGETLLPSTIADRVRRDLTTDEGLGVADLAPRLTATEQEVLRLLADGLQPAEVADTYEVSERLVNLHAGYAVTKLQRSSLESVGIELDGADPACSDPGENSAAPETSAV